MKIATLVVVSLLVGSLMVLGCSSVSAQKNQNTAQTREHFKSGWWEQQLDIG